MKATQLLMAFILSSLLLTTTVSAQGLSDILGKVATFLVDYIGIIFILLFLLILLIVGGVVKIPKGIPSPGLIIFAILIILAFVLPQFFAPYFPSYLEVPASFKVYKLPAGVEKALGLLGLPESWAYVPAIIYLFILPFAAIYTLVWAFLVTVEIFPQANVNRLLALIITVLTIPIGWFTNMVWALFSFMGAWSVAVFAATFILGIFFKGAGIAAKEIGEYKKYVKASRMKVEEMLEKLRAAREGTVAEMRNVATTLAPEAKAFGFHRVHELLGRAIVEEPDKVPTLIDAAIKELEKQK